MKRLVLIFACMFMGLSLSAQEDVLARLTEANFPDSLEAYFTQTRHSPMLTSDLVSKGKVSLAKPDYLRWEVISPKPSVSEFNGADGAAQRRFRIPSDKDFKITVLEGKEQSIILEPVRGDLKKLFSRIVVKADPATYLVHSVLLSGFDGDSTFIVFDHIRTK